MRTRTLGKSGLETTELALGTWGLSGEAYGSISDEDRERILQRALALGIRTFETADSYGNGAMESWLGERLPTGSDLLVITKVGTDRTRTPPVKLFSNGYVTRAVEGSVGRLRRNDVVIMLHNPSPEAVQRGEAVRALSDAVEAGTIRSWGVSAGSPEVVGAALEAGAPIISITYNVFHGAEMSRLRAQGVAEVPPGVLAHSVLSFGLLAGLWAPDRTFAEGDHRRERWTAEELRLRWSHLHAVRPAMRGDVKSLRAVALRYVLAEPLVSTVVIGPRSPMQLDQLVREAAVDPPYLPLDTITGLQARVDEVTTT